MGHGNALNDSDGAIKLETRFYNAKDLAARPFYVRVLYFVKFRKNILNVDGVLNTEINKCLKC